MKTIEKVNFIPYGRQYIDENDIASVVEVLKSDFITTGPKIDLFEKKLAKITGTKYAVAVNSGTSALHLACFAAGIKEGDEVITTPITFAATSNAVLYMGGKPVFADIDKKTYNLDPKDVEKKITEKTKAIIPVHYTGQICDMDRINNIAKHYNLTVIADASHAIGAEYKNKKVGTLANMTTLSFHPVKHITTGEGGAVVTDNEAFYNKMKAFRSHGIVRDYNDLIEKKDIKWYYEQKFLGFNYRMNDISAALGISQLKKLDKFIKRRNEIAKIYSDNLKKINGITIPEVEEGNMSAWHIYVIQVDEKVMSRDLLYERLSDKNIGVNLHYIPVYLHPYYQGLGYKKGLCKEAENFYKKIITIPIYPMMEDKDVHYVIDSIEEIVKNNI